MVGGSTKRRLGADDRSNACQTSIVQRAPAIIVLAVTSATLLGCPSTAPRPDASTPADALALDSPWSHPDVSRDAVTDPRLHVTVRDAIRREGLPCKLTIHGEDGTPTPDWGVQTEQIGEWLDRDNGALGIGRWVLLARGRASILLPPGRYSLWVTRGAEYAQLSLGRVELRADQGASVSGDLRRVVNTEGEVAGEFHVHSEPSFDSDVPIDQRVLSLAVEGIEVFASTDHDVGADFAPSIEALGLARFIHWMPGDEVTADGVGHFGAYPLPPTLDPSTTLTHDEPTVAGIIARARGVAPAAVIQLNHPLWDDRIGYWRFAGFDPTTGRARSELFASFDAVEVWNSHTLDQPVGSYVSPDGVIDAWMATLQLARGATAMGNSDTHRLAHSPPGWPRTYLRVPNDDPAGVTDSMVADAIRAGDAMLSSGPFLRATIGGARPGAIVRAAGGDVTVHVEAQTTWAPADVVEIVANRRVVAMRAFDAPDVNGVRRQDWDVPVHLTRDAWIVVRTRSDAFVSDLAGTHGRPLPSIALVNPLYVDVDGDGRWSPPGIDGGP